MSKTGVTMARTAVIGTAQNKEERNTAWCRQIRGSGGWGWGYIFPWVWFQDNNIWKNIHIATYIWSLVNYLFSERICKELLDFISHRGVFKRLLCIRNPSLQLVSGKECPPGLEKRAPGLFTLSLKHSRGQRPVMHEARLKCVYPAFAIQSHSFLYGTIH